MRDVRKGGKGMRELTIEGEECEEDSKTEEFNGRRKKRLRKVKEEWKSVSGKR